MCGESTATAPGCRPPGRDLAHELAGTAIDHVQLSGILLDDQRPFPVRRKHDRNGTACCGGKGDTARFSGARKPAGKGSTGEETKDEEGRNAV